MSQITLYRVGGADLRDASLRQVLTAGPNVQEMELRKDVAARLFIARSAPKSPDWIDYVAPLMRRRPVIDRSRALGAILFVQPNRRHRILYVATWGTGHFFLRTQMLDRDLGLRCVLNLMTANVPPGQWDPARLRSVRSRSRRADANILTTESQSARLAPLDTFIFSADVDQLRAVTGVPLDQQRWGKSVTGGVSLHVKRPEDIRELERLCRQLEDVFQSTDYRNYFAWIDNVKEIKTPDRVNAVEQEVARRLRDGAPEALAFAPPDLVSWEKVAQFQYRLGRAEQIIAVPSFESFREFLVDEDMIDEVDSNLLRRARVEGLNDAGEPLQVWSAWQCFVGEVQVGGATCMLDDGVLLEVAVDYLGTLNQFIDGIPASQVQFPTAAPQMHEAAYNVQLSVALQGAILLDQLLITRPGTTAIEVCDVALSQRKLIHVKRGVSSATLSHLFSQAAVSAELLLMDTGFRGRVQERLAQGVEGAGAAQMQNFTWLYQTPFQSAVCEVVYAIMTGRAAPIAASNLLPFFSKVNLRMRCDDLRRMGYTYSMALVSA